MDDPAVGWEAAAVAELARLEGPHLAKKRATIIHLVDARISGKPEETVFRLPNTCSRNIYHTKWKIDPIFSTVLSAVQSKAQTWHDTREMRALAAASRELKLATPDAVAALVASMAEGKEESTIVRAAIAILDRAGLETAPKSTASQMVKGYAVVSPGDWDGAEGAQDGAQPAEDADTITAGQDGAEGAQDAAEGDQ